jgi:hypothetical protein
MRRRCRRHGHLFAVVEVAGSLVPLRCSRCGERGRLVVDVAQAAGDGLLVAANLLLEALDDGAVDAAITAAVRFPARSMVQLVALAAFAFGEAYPDDQGREILVRLAMRRELAELIAEVEAGP